MQRLCNELSARKESFDDDLASKLDAVLRADADLSAAAANLLEMEVTLFDKFQLLKEGQKAQAEFTHQAVRLLSRVASIDDARSGDAVAESERRLRASYESQTERRRQL